MLIKLQGSELDNYNRDIIFNYASFEQRCSVGFFSEKWKYEHLCQNQSYLNDGIYYLREGKRGCQRWICSV